MHALIYRWPATHRYRVTARQLRRLSAGDLRDLWIAPAEIDRLAWQASEF